MTYHRFARRLVTMLMMLCIFVGVYFAIGLVAAGLIYFVGASTAPTILMAMLGLWVLWIIAGMMED